MDFGPPKSLAPALLFSVALHRGQLRNVNRRWATATPDHRFEGGGQRMLWTILGWMLFGLIVGAIARFIVPGRQSMGLLATMALGVIGSFAGGFLAFLVFGGGAVRASGWIGSLIGAVILVWAAERLGSRSSSHR